MGIVWGLVGDDGSVDSCRGGGRGAIMGVVVVCRCLLLFEHFTLFWWFATCPSILPRRNHDLVNANVSNFYFDHSIR